MTYNTFSTKHGTIQKNFLSFLLFIIYLGVTLRDRCTSLNATMGSNSKQAFSYFDDVASVHRQEINLIRSPS